MKMQSFLHAHSILSVYEDILRAVFSNQLFSTYYQIYLSSNLIPQESEHWPFGKLKTTLPLFSLFIDHLKDFGFHLARYCICLLLFLCIHDFSNV